MPRQDFTPGSSVIDLDELYRRYPASPVMRDAARNWLRALARSKAGRRPLTGSYFWLPRLVGPCDVTWQIKEFFDEWLPSSDHAYAKARKERKFAAYLSTPGHGTETCRHLIFRRRRKQSRPGQYLYR